MFFLKNVYTFHIFENNLLDTHGWIESPPKVHQSTGLPCPYAFVGRVCVVIILLLMFLCLMFVWLTFWCSYVWCFLVTLDVVYWFFCVVTLDVFKGLLWILSLQSFLLHVTLCITSSWHNKSHCHHRKLFQPPLTNPSLLRSTSGAMYSGVPHKV